MNLHEFFTPAIIWFLVGLVLLLLELAIPGLIIVFFGVGAWLTSLSLVFFDWGINAQLLIFVITSMLSLIVLRKYLKKKFFTESENKSTLEEEFIGKTAITEMELKAGIPGKVSFKGTQWNAISDVDVAAGQQVIVNDKESITLKVSKK
ncbi:MAG: NfeD family protein [Bacteroidales bacterium]|nr:NfeD family protein [Bacteroidales bacterium]MBN2818882.1 NfeD family protein [Bacteroidales bacterium]